MLNSDLTASNFNTDETKRAVSFFKDLHDEGIIPTSVWLGSENPNNLFRTGQVAMHFAGSWMIANYKEEITDFDWGVTYLPKDPFLRTGRQVPGCFPEHRCGKGSCGIHRMDFPGGEQCAVLCGKQLFISG